MRVVPGPFLIDGKYSFLQERVRCVEECPSRYCARCRFDCPSRVSIARLKLLVPRAIALSRSASIVQRDAHSFRAPGREAAKCLRAEQLSDFGAGYLILLGAVAIAVMVLFPKGLWGSLAERFDLHVFPVRRRLIWAIEPPATLASAQAHIERE